MFPDSGTDAAKIQNFPVSTVDPASGQTLVYNSVTKQWEPTTPAATGVPLTRVIGSADLSADRSLADIGAIPEAPSNSKQYARKNGAWSEVTSGSPPPAAITAGTTLSSAHNGAVLVLASTQLITINTGLPSGFGCSIKGAFTYGGTATVTDARYSGSSYPWCSLVNTGTDTYDLVGGKT